MSDPRFDGSLDAPPARNGNWMVDVELNAELSELLNQSVEFDVELESVVVDIEPRSIDVVIENRPLRQPAQKRRRMTGEDTVIDTGLEAIHSELSAREAAEIAHEVCTLAGCNVRTNENVIFAATVMLANWSESSSKFGFPKFVDQIRARLLRDSVAVEVTGMTMLRASWLSSEEESLAFVLDAMVGAGEIRRTWRGSYRNTKGDVEYEPWTVLKTHREFITELLRNRSATMNEIRRELMACGLERSTYNMTTMVELREMKEERLVGYRKFGGRASSPNVWYILESS